MPPELLVPSPPREELPGDLATVPAGSSALRAQLAQTAAFLDRHTLAASTQKKYREAWASFEAWCSQQNLPALPCAPGTLAVYLRSLAEPGPADPPRPDLHPDRRGGSPPRQGAPLRPASIRQAAAAVGWQHARHGLDRPDRAEVVRAMLGATGRALGLAPTRKAALDVEGLRAIVATLRPGLAGARDRALLALGLSTGMRRSELVALDRADLRPVGTGFDVVIRKSKTDQARKGRVCTVAPGRFPATCPCRALTAWLAALDAEGIGDGAIFRAIDRHRRVLDRLTPAAVARIVQRAARDAGLDPAPLAGHSLRAGFVTAAARAQKPLHRIMEQSGHRSADVALAYIRDHG